jgi:hypothetical protein
MWSEWKWACCNFGAWGQYRLFIEIVLFCLRNLLLMPLVSFPGRVGAMGRTYIDRSRFCRSDWHSMVVFLVPHCRTRRWRLHGSANDGLQKWKTLYICCTLVYYCPLLHSPLAMDYYSSGGASSVSKSRECKYFESVRTYIQWHLRYSPERDIPW